jgi:hypothetical protein
MCSSKSLAACTNATLTPPATGSVQRLLHPASPGRPYQLSATFRGPKVPAQGYRGALRDAQRQTAARRPLRMQGAEPYRHPRPIDGIPDSCVRHGPWPVFRRTSANKMAMGRHMDRSAHPPLATGAGSLNRSQSLAIVPPPWKAGAFRAAQTRPVHPCLSRTAARSQ